jgi:ABC-type transporter Mla subunit MlaD
MEKGKNYLDSTAQLVTTIKSLSESYRLLVEAAEEFNKITLAHKRDLEDAIDRADDLGDIIDKLIKILDKSIEKDLQQLKFEEKEQDQRKEVYE